MSNVTFFHNDFYAICIAKSCNSHISVVVCSFFEFGIVSKWCIREWVKHCTNLSMTQSCNLLKTAMITRACPFSQSRHGLILFRTIFAQSINPCWPAQTDMVGWLHLGLTPLKQLKSYHGGQRCTCVSWLFHTSTNTNFFPKPPTAFLTCFSRGER